MRTYTDARRCSCATDTGVRAARGATSVGRRVAADRFVVAGTNGDGGRAGRSSARTAWGSRPGSTRRSRARSTVTLADGSRVEATPGFALVRARARRAGRRSARPRSPASPPRRSSRSRAPTPPRRPPRSSWAAAATTGTTATSPAAPSRSWPPSPATSAASGGGFSVYVGQYKVRVDTSPWWNPARTRPSRPRRSTSSAAAPRRCTRPSRTRRTGCKALFCTFANMFAAGDGREPAPRDARRLELVVVVDHQMTDTAKWADIVLPATTWYEKTDLTATPLHPFLQIQQAAIPPVGRVALRALDVARDRQADRPGGRRAATSTWTRRRRSRRSWPRATARRAHRGHHARAAQGRARCG